MRKQFVTTLEEKLSSDIGTTLLLGDIGVYGFKNASERFPSRVINIGILEGAMVSVAAGLSKNGLIPIVHSIAPFLIERAFEQIKIDFGYQKLRGNLVSVGSSYDYASLGATHHCPGDVGLLLNIPNIEIVVPGTSEEFDFLFNESYSNKFCTYFRLSEYENQFSQEVKFGEALVIKEGALGTVLVVGPLLSKTLQALEGIDVNVIYYTTLQPFDFDSIRQMLKDNKKLLIVEPFYQNTLALVLAQHELLNEVNLISIGIPRKFIEKYGVASDHDEVFGFTSPNIRKRAKDFFYEK
jgi:transketolase